MINVNGNLAKGLNSEKIKKAKGIYSFPAFVPQFKDGGEVYKDGGGVRQRLAKAAPNLAEQSRQLRYNVQNPPGQTFVKPQTSPAMEPIKVGPRSDYVGSALQRGPGLAPNVVDSQMVGNVAHNLASGYNGPYKDKVQSMFPQPSGMSRQGSLAQKVFNNVNTHNVNPETIMDFAQELFKEKPGSSIDSRVVGNVAHNLASGYNGPYKDNVQTMFPRYKDGGKVESMEEEPMLKKDEYGMIEGPGTGTSDDIPAELKEKDFILTAQAAQHFGEENIMRLVMIAMQQEGMEGMENNATVQALVSNGEIRIPEQAVEFYGLDFWRNINNMDVNSTNKMKDGKPAYAYGGDVEDDDKKVSPLVTAYENSTMVKPFAEGVSQGYDIASNAIKNKFNEVGQRADRIVGKQNPVYTPNEADKNYQTSLAATSNRLQNEARGVNLAQPAISDKVDPNIYGPGGVNYGANPSKEQVNQLFEPNLAEKGPSELDKYKQFLQAQSEAQSAFNDRERTQNEILYRNYGTALPGGERLDYGAGFTPAQLNTQQNIAGLNAQTELAKTNTLADVERYKADQPQYDVRINDEGEPVYFQKSGIGVENQGNQQQSSTRVINAKKYLQDPRSTAEQKQSALEYLKSLGLI